ncbi:MAG TPA: glucosamine-6-phosphate deaminase [Acidimicrobiia bacterium]|nr:glucosamine-6-phosphate deaminase [Acidimicrobiia bacterium]
MRVEVLPASSWAEAVTAELIDRLEPAGLRLCLATGATPLPVYARLPGDALATSTVFLLDEFGGLPAGHRGRCEMMLRNALLDRVAAGEFHFPDVDAPDLDVECRRYRDLINEGGLDLAVLGLGMNGHLGLNEPGSTADQPTRVVELTAATREGARNYGADPPPTWGLAVGLMEILAAREVWLLVTGSSKADVLARVVNDEVTDRVPATLLRTHPNSIIWADEAAAARL